jgi:RHS repeat-associated protein
VQHSNATAHLGARDYEAWSGLWLQADTIIPDPKNPQSLNRYSYVLGNPTRSVDPTGRAPEDPRSSSPIDRDFVDSPDYRRALETYLGFDEGSLMSLQLPAYKSPQEMVSVLDQILRESRQGLAVFNNMKQGGVEAAAFMAAWMTTHFDPGGKWDFKKDYNRNDSRWRPAADFGNFVYGVVLGQWGFNATSAQQIGGATQWASDRINEAVNVLFPGSLPPDHDSRSGGPGEYPFGDNPRDAQFIRSGWSLGWRLR